MTAVVVVPPPAAEEGNDGTNRKRIAETRRPNRRRHRSSGSSPNPNEPDADPRRTRYVVEREFQQRTTRRPSAVDVLCGPGLRGGEHATRGDDRERGQRPRDRRADRPAARVRGNPWSLIVVDLYC